MKKDEQSFEHVEHRLDRRGAADRAAGVFLLDGKWHIAAYDTAAEDALLLAGALHIASLRFDRLPQAADLPNADLRSIPLRIAPGCFRSSRN